MLSSHISNNMFLQYLYTHFPCKTLHGTCNTKTCSGSDTTSACASRLEPTPSQITPERFRYIRQTCILLLLKLINDGSCSNSAIETEPEESYSWSDWYSETSEKLSDRLIAGSWSSLHTISKW